MGRVAKYKKVKKSLETRGEYIWGTKTVTKVKKRSLVAEALKKKKLKRRGAVDDVEDGFDVPLAMEDDFQLSDLTGTLVRESPKLMTNNQRRNAKSNNLGDESASTMPTISGTSPPKGDGNVRMDRGNLDMQPTDDATTQVASSIRTVKLKAPQSIEDEKKLAHMLRIDSRGVHHRSITNPATKLEHRKKGESMNAFYKRLNEETRLILSKDLKDGERSLNPEKRDKRREFLKKKQLQKKKKRNQHSFENEFHNDGEYDGISQSENDGSVVTGERRAVVVRGASFLDQVERPPVFRQLPRGAKHREKKINDDHGEKMTELEEQKIRAEQINLQVMRKKVQAQYAIVKARRQQKTRDFSL